MTNSKKVDGTIAKEVAIYFLDRTSTKITPQLMARTVGQVKNLMKDGYSKEDMTSSIDYILDKTNKNMHSFGYLRYAIDEALEKINEEIVREQVKLMEDELSVTRDDKNEVIDVESKERNRDKISKFGFKPWEREEYYRDLFE